VAGRGTILLVDDADDVRSAVRRLLESEGFDVLEASNGREGLHALYSARPDLVMLDVNMPDMDGWQTLDRVRELTTVPVLMLSARGEKDDKVRGLRGGADDYMVKPFAPEELFARVEALLRRAGSGTEPAPAPPDPKPPKPHQPKDPW
jgi:DNA-binding response OmpR family regulator